MTNTWRVGTTATGRSIHAVKFDKGIISTYCNHPAARVYPTLWKNRDEDMLWCTRCAEAPA